jgi:LAS superfamily LD-carboxypeptidase LdcB
MASVSVLLIEKSTEINLIMQNDGFSVAQICILMVLCLILFILLGFVVRIILRARIKQKINIRNKEACEMSSFTTRMRRHVKDPVHDFDVTTDLLECTRDSRKDKNKFEDVSLISKNSLANENFSTKFTTTVDIHPQANI